MRLSTKSGVISKLSSRESGLGKDFRSAIMQFQTLLEEVKRGNAAVERKKLEEIEQRYFIWRATGKVRHLFFLEDLD